MIDSFDQNEPESWKDEVLAGSESDRYWEIVERIREFKAKGAWLKDELEGMFLKISRWVRLADSFSDGIFKQNLIESCALAEIFIAVRYLDLFVGLEYPSREDCVTASAMIGTLFLGQNLNYLTMKDSLNAKRKAGDDTYLKIDEAISMIIMLYPRLLIQ